MYSSVYITALINILKMKKTLLSLLVLSLSTLLVAGCTNSVEPVDEEVIDENVIVEVEENLEEAEEVVDENLEEAEEVVDENLEEAEEVIDETLEEAVEVVAE